MKPQAFAYRRPQTLDQALADLAEGGEDAKVLSGGQSLLPMMNFRLARPSMLVDISRIEALTGISVTQDEVRIGATTRHIDVEHCTVPGPTGSLLRVAARNVGHLPIRTRGTFGGSIAHSDPSSEWCMLAMLLDARMTIAGPSGIREVPSDDFFVTVFTTAVEYDEILVAVTLPLLAGSYRVRVEEFARRAGDFAIVGIMTAYEVVDGVIGQARLVAGGVADRAIRLRGAERALVGQSCSPETFALAAEVARDEVDPAADLHGSSGYRKDLVRTLTRRALERAEP